MEGGGQVIEGELLVFVADDGVGGGEAVAGCVLGGFGFAVGGDGTGGELCVDLIGFDLRGCGHGFDSLVSKMEKAAGWGCLCRFECSIGFWRRLGLGAGKVENEGEINGKAL